MNVEIYPPSKQFDLPLERLLQPGAGFDHPMDVVNDHDLTTNEKRAILAAWASDARAVESSPTLRQGFGGLPTVSIDEIMSALCALDRQPESASQPWLRRQLRRSSIEALRALRSKDVGRALR
jgi:hypothetical protein